MDLLADVLALRDCPMSALPETAMRMTRGYRPSLLSPRERDCLRLVSDGLTAPAAAAGLGVAVSTFNKHLASARHKLGVARTAQAVLLCRPRQDDGRPPPALVAARGTELVDFLDDLDACETFDEAWTLLLAHARRLGVTSMTCGLCAEPPGQLTNGARALRTSWSQPLIRMYEAVGGVRIDPMVPYVVFNTRGIFVDNERVLRAVAGLMPRQTLIFGDALLDNGMRFMVCQPGRDSATRAPHSTTFVLDPRLAEEMRHRASPAKETLGALAGAFWATIQSRHLLRGESGLTPRQAEALTFAARGFSTAETAEHMGVSQRSAEKTLAAARRSLGARTTAAAVFRAVVYRALG